MAAAVKTHAFLIGLVLAFAAFPGSTAVAQDRQICARLTSQLHSHTGDRPPTRHYQRYATSVDHQRRRIERTRRDLQRLGCSAGSVISFGGGYSECRHLMSDLNGMEADLIVMEADRDAHAGHNGATRQRIVAALRANGCHVPGGVRIRRNLGVAGDDGVYDFSDPTVRYRTLCVRSCDGYFFPVSYAVPPTAFDSDAARCSAMCPGTDARLFVHRVPEEDSSDMVSVASQTPYIASPNAFAYRNRRDGREPACSCELSATAGGAAQSTSRGSIVTLPAKKQAPGTQSGRTESQTAASAPEAPLRDIDPNQRVRVVGPTFLPDQSETIDLRAHPATQERAETR